MLVSHIKDRINETPYTRKYISEQLGVSHQQISNWSVGASFPTAERMFKLAFILGCKVDDLYSYISN